MLKNALSDTVNWQNKKVTEELCKVSNACLDDHHFKKEELESVGELSEVCSHIVLKCMYLARICRTRHLMDSEQTCSSRHQMDKSM